jgi:hypothetical protein
MKGNTKRPSIAIPWALPHYSAANAFHPLYSFLFDRNVEITFDLVTLNEQSIASALAKDPSLVYKAEQLLPCGDHLFAAASDRLKPYTDFVGVENLRWQEALPGDLEFHHTMPFATLQRPFVFHCESFVPTFFPFLQQGLGRSSAMGADLQWLRTVYKPKYEHQSCLAIVSHIRETLDQFSAFFESKVIDRKLTYLPVGLTERTLNRLSQRRNENSAPTFLFTWSAHQNPNNFRLRGGAAVLRFLAEYRSTNKPGNFIFRCAKPADENIREMGISPSEIEESGNIKIKWISEYQSDDDMLALFNKADFFLLPSANLHSASIMQAMAAGCIPVVSDTQGTSEFVSDMEDGIVLRGVRSRVWESPPGCNVCFDWHDAFLGMERELADTLGARVFPLLDSLEQQRAMREAARARASAKFRGLPLAQRYWSLVEKRFASRPKQRMPRQVKTAPESVWAKLLPDALERRSLDRYFARPPQPLLVEATGEYRIFSVRSLYWAIRHDVYAKSFAHPRAWNLLSSAVQQAVNVGQLHFSADLPALREKIESLSQNYPSHPVVIRSENGINLVRMRELVFGIPQRLGSVDLAQDLESIKKQYGPDQIVIGSDLDQVIAESARLVQFPALANATQSVVHRVSKWRLLPFRRGLPPDFDGAIYLELNPDVARAGMDPARHFLKYGRREGRKWKEVPAVRIALPPPGHDPGKSKTMLPPDIPWTNGSSPAELRLVALHGEFNIVLFLDRYWAVPVALGPVDFGDERRRSHPEIKSAETYDQLIAQLGVGKRERAGTKKEQKRSIGRSLPSPKSSL